MARAVKADELVSVTVADPVLLMATAPKLTAELLIAPLRVAFTTTAGVPPSDGTLTVVE